MEQMYPRTFGKNSCEGQPAPPFAAFSSWNRGLMGWIPGTSLTTLALGTADRPPQRTRKTPSLVASAHPNARKSLCKSNSHLSGSREGVFFPSSRHHGDPTAFVFTAYPQVSPSVVLSSHDCAYPSPLGWPSRTRSSY